MGRQIRFRWIPDEEDPENKKVRVEQTQYTMQDLYEKPAEVLGLKASVHENANGEEYIRIFTDQFDSPGPGGRSIPQMALASARMKRRTNRETGEVYFELSLAPWINTHSGKGSDAGGGEAEVVQEASPPKISRQAPAAKAPAAKAQPKVKTAKS